MLFSGETQEISDHDQITSHTMQINSLPALSKTPLCDRIVIQEERNYGARVEMDLGMVLQVLLCDDYLIIRLSTSKR